MAGDVFYSDGSIEQPIPWGKKFVKGIFIQCQNKSRLPVKHRRLQIINKPPTCVAGGLLMI